MGYSDSQKKRHIYELQRYLHAISLMNDNIPTIVPDGIYGNETIIAVTAFQREYGLKDTGITNPETWNTIVSVYKSILIAEPLPFDVFPSKDYISAEGDEGMIVYIIQAMLNHLGNRYDNAPKTDVTGIYTKDTSDSVAHFQKWCGIHENGKVDSPTWNLLVKCCEK